MKHQIAAVPTSTLANTAFGGTASVWPVERSSTVVRRSAREHSGQRLGFSLSSKVSQTGCRLSGGLLSTTGLDGNPLLGKTEPPRHKPTTYQSDMKLGIENGYCEKC